MTRARKLLLLLSPLLAFACEPSEVPPPPPPPVPSRVEAVQPTPTPTPAPVPLPTPAPDGPSVRREGNLIVEWPSRHRTIRGGRLRTHVSGPLTARSTRYWAGPTRPPDWLPLTRGALELALLDETSDGFFALYREPYDATNEGCSLSGRRRNQNCSFVAAFFAPDRTERWAHRLNEHMSRPDRLEVQDARYGDGVVYFNEACQSYSREAGGRCSSLVALDTTTGRVRWRTGPLVSNNHIELLDRHVVAAYGFTAERDVLSLVSRDRGEVVARLDMPAAAERLAIAERSPAQAIVEVYLSGRGLPWLVRAEGLDGPAPRLVPEVAAPPEQPSRLPVLRRGMRDRDVF